MMAAAMLASAGAVTAQPTQLRPISGTRLDVLATSEVTRVPDIVDIDAGISTVAPTASEAIRANGEAMDRLRAALRGAGIEARDIQTSHVDLDTVVDHRPSGPPILRGYRASHRLDIRFREAANAGRMLDTLVAAGASEIYGVSFDVEQTDAMRDEARDLALAEARSRADRYARSLGMRVVRVLAVTERGATGGSGLAPVSSAAGNSPSTNIALGEASVGYTLAVTFELE
jgi:uncharacterized protein